jgi:hypothetical protein
MASVRITSAPPGEAPAEIRQAWVGLELPIVRRTPQRYLGSGVLTGPRSIRALFLHLFTLRLHVHVGYVVPSLEAIDILEKSRPEAARWWHEHAPQMLQPKRRFLFAPECCEIVQ